ncbi:MAG: hypothetical protein EOP87_11895 [Verrucomicrobiaceae bacterium]|nr:MAG: hypothetical protein EOP87_11895 [Verrucomicrobiaceae bacterium]
MFAAFHIPDLPIVAALVEHPEWQDRPCAVLRDPTDKEDAKIPLLSMNFAAWETGIAPGWPLNRALVRCPGLMVVSRCPDKETQLLAELVAFADRFSADVEIASPDTVLLDLSGTKRKHFNGMECLPDSEVEVTHALADTPDLAHFAVLEPKTRRRFISIREIGMLPLSLLGRIGDDAGFLPQLQLLGLQTLGDFRQLPKQEVTVRYGARAGYWHDLISGKTHRLLKLHRPPESFLQSMEFDDPVHSGEALLFVCNRMLHVLASRVAARHVAVGILKVRLILIEGHLNREIHLPEPLADPPALLKPIQTLIDSLVLPSPVMAVELDADVALPLSRQQDWTKRQLPDPERWADTLARLEALVGNGRVGIPVPLASHGSDAFTVQDAVVMESSSPASPPPPHCSLPLRRFRPAKKISVFSEPARYPRPLALLTGPHCGQVLESRGPFPSSGNYWDPDASWGRVEWDIQVEHAPLLRLSYQPGERWQLEGIY